MPGSPDPVSLDRASAVRLIAHAAGYLRYTLAGVVDSPWEAPTPCSAWCLAALLAHVADSVTAFTELVAKTHLARAENPADASRSSRQDPVTHTSLLLDRFRSVLDAMDPSTATCTIADQPVPLDVVLHAGALELAVHAWDVACVVDERPQIPTPLAQALLPIARRLVVAGSRAPQFRPPRTAADPGTSSDRLIAYLGR